MSHSQAQGERPATQSWASWILDSYASSVSPYGGEGVTESQFDPETVDPDNHEIKSPISLLPDLLPSSPSSHSTYVKVGRGGASNFFSLSSSSTTTPQHETDVEKSPTTGTGGAGRGHRRQSSLTERQRAAAQAERMEMENELSSLQREQKRKNSGKPEMIRVGIGGAGNFALSQGPEIQSPRLLNGVGYGRDDGAATGIPESLRRNKDNNDNDDDDDDKERKKTREKVEAEVDGILKAPEGAWVKEGREVV